MVLEAKETERTSGFWKNKYVLIIGIVIVLAIAVDVGMYFYLNSPARIGVASVNGQVITKDEFIKAIISQNGQSALDGLIENTLIRQEAKKEGVTVTDQEVQDRINSFKTTLGSEEKFASLLSMYGITEETLKEQLIPQMLAEKLITKDKTITDKELMDFFVKNKSSFDEKEMVMARHILVKTQEEAQDVLNRLKRGEDFAKLAKEKSIDTATKDQGGEMGWIGRGAVDSALENVLFSLKKGEMTPIVKTAFGYEIAQVQDKKAARSVPFNEVKDKVRESYIADMVQKNYSTWIQGLKASANIVYYITK
ncbi:MAG: peptidylprolyl isomerase [bacterium]